MKSTISRLLAFVLLLSATGLVHAEGGCPAGYYPIGAPQGTQGPQGCAPIPGNNQQQAQPLPPPPIWVDHWGAIATDGPGGSFGASTDMSTRQSAEEAALADCHSKKGSSTCGVDLYYRNQCAAMVVGHETHNSKAGSTVDLAIQAAMNLCNEVDKSCFVYYTACSLPVRIQ